MWIVHGIPVYFAMPLAILVGALVGLFNGMLVTQLKIPSFIVTLGSYNLLYGVTLWVSNTGTFNPAYPPAGKTVPKGELDFFVGLTQSIGSFQLSIEVIWMIAIAIVVGLLLHRSLFGFRLMAIGGNPVAASLARLPVRSYKVMAFVLCGVLAAVAGVLDFSFIQTSQPNTGLSATFPVFAAVIIGGASLSGGKGTVIGTLGGALLLAELQLGLSIPVARRLCPADFPRRGNNRRGGAGSVPDQAAQEPLVMTPVLERGISLRGVAKAYGATLALAGVDLDLRPGEVLGVAGPNGAGKSTLVRMIAGEERPTLGKLTFDGRSWSPVDEWQAVAVVHQEPQLFPNLTVAENVMVGREGSGNSHPVLSAADAAVMDALGIGHLKDKALEDCSLATQQRTEIARAVARDSRVFLFDEPNSALTAEESDELFREIHKLAASGRIVVLVTHRLADFVAHCDRVAVVRDGKVRVILEGDALTEDAIARQLVTESAASSALAVARSWP